MNFRRLKKHYGYNVPSRWIYYQKLNVQNLNRCKKWKRTGKQPKGLPNEMVDVLITLHRRSIKFMDEHMWKYKHYFV